MTTRHWLMDEWRDAFLIQARLHDVPGSTIGEALAEIDTHCADSGQSPDEAFGDPVVYAKTLARDQRPGSRGSIHRRPWRSAPTTLATLSGITLLINGVDAVAHGTDGVITAGQLVFVAAGVIGTAVIVTVAFAVTPHPGRRDRTWWLAAAATVATGSVTFASLAWQQVVVRGPGWILLTAGLLLLTLAWWPLLSGRSLADRVVDPRTGREPFRQSRLLMAVIRWGLPVGLLCLVLLTVLLPTASR
jgi:hypothetical protein